MTTLKAVVQARTVIRACRQSCYAALTTADGLNAWFTTGSDIDPRPGGKMVWRWHDWGPDHADYTSYGRVLDMEPPARFLFEWWGEDESRKTQVEFTFEERPDGTLVTVRESGFVDDELRHRHPLGQGKRLGRIGHLGEVLPRTPTDHSRPILTTLSGRTATMRAVRCSIPTGMYTLPQ